MKRVMGIATLALMLGSVLFVQSALAAEGQAVTVTGTIIDNACASGHMGDLAGFAKTHTKECLLMPACVESGYGIYSGGAFYKFDKASNAKVEAYLREQGNTAEATVTGKTVGKEFAIDTIGARK